MIANMEIDFDGVAETLVLGYTLDSKTMLKNVKIPSAPVPDFELGSKPTTIDDVYEALRRAVCSLLKPHTAIRLSGGLDSRIIAAMASQFDKSVIAITYGESQVEKRIARKISHVLGLRHYSIDDEYLLSDELMPAVERRVIETGGTMRLHSILFEMIEKKHLQDLAIKNVITGAAFDEINGSSIGPCLISKSSFCNILVKHSHPILPNEYRQRVFGNLLEHCENIQLKKLFLCVTIRNRFLRSLKNPFNMIIPLLSPDVISAILSLPYHERMNKNIQKRILRKYFPKLFKIPNSSSMLPPSLPYILHRAITKAVRTLYIRRKYPLLPVSQPHFFKTNLHFFHEALVGHPPPLLNSRQIKWLISRLSHKDADLLARIVPYSLILSLEKD